MRAGGRQIRHPCRVHLRPPRSAGTADRPDSAWRRRRSTSVVEVRTTRMMACRRSATASSSAAAFSRTDSACRSVCSASAETSVMRPLMSLAAAAVSVTLNAMPMVAAACFSTAEATRPAMALISPIVCSIRATAATAAWSRRAPRRCAGRCPRSSARSAWRATSPRWPPRRSPCRPRPPAPPRSSHSAPADWSCRRSR